MVRLDLYDYLGKRKEYGGDFLRVRIHSPSLQAGASGHIKDYRNGTYLVNFTLFWEGAVRVSLLLIHPSEGVSALWAARKKGFDKIAFTGQFLNGTAAVLTPCGFNISGRAELCEYRDERDQEVFYCVKPKNVPCEAFVLLKSSNKPVSYLTDLEQRLLKRSNIGVAIPEHFGEIHVLTCNRGNSTPSKQCSVGMRSPPFPSGFVWHDQWYPVFCRLPGLGTLNQINTCLQRKMVYFMGDSTVRQWMEYLTNTVRTLKIFDAHGIGKLQNLLAVDMAGNIQLQWKKHGHPITAHSYTMKDHSYVAREIDNLAGDRDTAVVVSLGQHFRPFPIKLFIRRILNVRAAIQHLLLRSPGTRVIIKTENTQEMPTDPERFSDFHGYAQYLAARDVFRDLKVGIIDAWDITVAYATTEIHPPDQVIGSQVNLFLSYIC
ncbi:NXPE family member 4-like [Tiliqua scincoides]|uniref:NXPE family member 4-like n=1 Tax=Tiliqua scincoides TaxID=71010 RepID=UPI0034618473